jgi:hypothetical protein
LVWITLWDGNYAVYIVASAHVYDETKNLGLFVAIRVSYSERLPFVDSNDLMNFGFALRIAILPVSIDRRPGIAFREHSLSSRRLMRPLCARCRQVRSLKGVIQNGILMVNDLH